MACPAGEARFTLALIPVYMALVADVSWLAITSVFVDTIKT